MLYKLIVLLTSVLNVNSYTICVAGASSALGKELIYQALNTKNYNVIALTNNTDNVRIPYRGGGLDDLLLDKIEHENIQFYNYTSIIPHYDALILTMGGSAFETTDYSFDVTKHLLDNICYGCKSVALVSAFGVGNSIKGANLGIRSMRSWYLKNVYISKEKQENLLNNNYYNNVNKKIYRPKVLSFGNTIFESTTRENLAKVILDEL
tara:strand:+ start:19606 stop:20229 length:624 start_codon:yes stop_codon:yes gene_type:complete